MVYVKIRPYLFWFLGLLFVFLQFFLQLSIGVLLPTLEKALNLNPLEIGELAASYYITYVLLQLPAGALLDIFGTRILLSLGALFCGFGCWLLSMSDTLYFAMFARVLMGLGASFAFVGAVQIVYENFPARQHSFMIGVTESVAMITALFSNTFFAGLLQEYSWRHIFAFAGMLAICIATLQWFLLPASSIYSAGGMKRLVRSCRSMLVSIPLWANGAYCGLMFTLISAFSGLWAMPFLMSIQKVPFTNITMEASMIFLGVAIGSPVAGWLYKNFNNIRIILFWSGVLALIISSWIIYFTPISAFLGGALFTILGVICCGYVVNYPLACDLVEPVERGAALGFTNMLCVCTAPLMHVGIGYIIERSSMHSGHETVLDFRLGLCLLSIALICAIFLVRLIPNKPN